MPGVVERHMDLLEYSILHGFTGRELIESIAIDPAKVTGLAADSLGNYWINAGTILCKVPTDSTKHTVLGGWTAGAETGEGGNNQKEGNNDNKPTAQVQTITAGAVSKFFLVDNNGDQTTELEVKSSAAAVEAALNKLAGSSGGYKVALTSEGIWKVTSQGNLLGLDKTLTVKEVSGAEVKVAQTTPGQVISGILGFNLRFFDLTAGSVVPASQYMFSCAFDKTRIQNFAFYQAALLASPALRNSTFS